MAFTKAKAPTFHAPRSFSRGIKAALRTRKKWALAHRWLCGCLLAVIFVVSVSPAAGQSTGTSPASGIGAVRPRSQPSYAPPRSEFDLLLVQVSLNEILLAEDMAAYLNGDSILIPLRDFTQLLDFPIEVHPADGTADGWFLKENRLFSLNLEKAEVVISGQIKEFSKNLVEAHQKDIFVDAKLLTDWFPVNINFIMSKLEVRLSSREPLPVEQRIARELIRKRTFSSIKEDYSGLPEKDVPFKPFGWPLANISTESSYTLPDDGKRGFLTQYNALVAADFAYTNMQLFLSGGFPTGESQDLVSDVRLRFDRLDPNGDVFNGRLKSLEVKRLSAGDIFSPQLSMVTTTKTGRGFEISSLPLDAPSEFDRITLTGELPLGWELELYRNEVLLDFQAARSDGRYEFQDVPLLFGVNLIRLIFYGPQGQIREEVRQLRVGTDLVTPGQVLFRVFGNQQDRTIIRQDDQDDFLEGKERMIAEVLYGISKNFSVAGNFISIPIDDTRTQYTTLSGRFSIRNLFGRLDFVNQRDRGWASKLSAQTSLGGVSIIMEHNILSDFSSEQFTSTTDETRSFSKVRLDGAIPKTILPQIPFALTVDHTRTEARDTETNVAARLSATIGRISSSNTLTHQRVTGSEPSKSLSGDWLIGGRYKKVRVRGQMTYDVFPINTVNTFTFTGDWAITDVYQGKASVSRDLSDKPLTTFSVGLNTGYDLAAIGFNLEYDTANDFEAKISTSFGIGRDPNAGRFFISKDKQAERGLAALRIFLDNDTDGKFSDGDEPLEGVKFYANNTPLKGKTDASGRVLLKGLEPYHEIALRVDQGTLADPFWLPEPEGIRVIPRPGSTIEYDFPVVSTGEIDGTVQREWDDGPGAVAGVIVQLVDSGGKVIKEVKSAYDGFFLIDYVRPGNYRLRVSPDQMKSLGLKEDRQYDIAIEGDEPIFNGQDFLLVPLEKKTKPLAANFVTAWAESEATYRWAVSEIAYRESAQSEATYRWATSEIAYRKSAASLRNSGG